MAIQILEQVPLAPMTTMRVGGNARFFVRVESIDELKQALLFASEKNLPHFILGGGSNTLVSDEGFLGLVIKMEFHGITLEGDRMTACAGEVWDDVVLNAVTHELWGIENLSLIPGTVGGAVVQNIGAYGIEVCDSIFLVKAFDTETMQEKTFVRDECEFGYRESIFKKNKKLIVVSVTLELIKNGIARTNYEDVNQYFIEYGVTEPTLGEIRNSIVSIRNKKMPAFPLGTAGSFFKNPVVSMDEYKAIKEEFPEMKAYLQGDNSVKLSAAWIIDHLLGLRGFRDGNVGVHEKQALILINYGNANAKEILKLVSKIKSEVKQKINVSLEEEVVMM
jgi:UDP-N-acetylmuramate dehydrogenase